MDACSTAHMDVLNMLLAVKFTFSMFQKSCTTVCWNGVERSGAEKGAGLGLVLVLVLVKQARREKKTGAARKKNCGLQRTAERRTP